MNDIVEHQNNAPTIMPTTGAVTPIDLLRHAMNSGADLDRLDRLMEMQQRWEADMARKAFAEDMARFKAEKLVVGKDKHVRFKTSNGVTEYDHATIGNVCDVIVPALAKFGFAHRWDSEQRDGLIIVRCVITHRLGHSQSTTLQAAPDASGGKNGIQSIISAQTYLQRHTLLAATGVATKDQEDDDGKFGSTDTKLADEWIAKVKACKTDAEVLSVWAAGVGIIEASGDTHAYDEFKNAVAVRRADFEKKGGKND